jgi:hypothetical protein
LASTILTVTTTNDNGDGSLRQVISDANTDSPPITINFAIPPFDGTIKTIQPQSGDLPAITNSLAINGFSQSGASTGTISGTLTNNPVLLIALDGSFVGGGPIATGLTFSVAGSVQGLIVQNFPGIGLSVAAGATLTENILTNNLVGIVIAGNTNTCTGNFLLDNNVAINVLGPSNTFNANQVLHSTSNGVIVAGTGNSFVENLIASNTAQGVFVSGGTNSFATTTISFNGSAGVYVTGDGNSFSSITVSSNGSDGVDIQAFANTISSSTIASNATHGVNIGGAFGSFNVNASSNTLSGVTVFANGGDGVVLGGSSNLFVNGTSASNTANGVFVVGLENIIGGNVILENASNGIEIAAVNITSAGPTRSDFNIVQGNSIGTDFSGTNALGNGLSGVLIDGTLLEASGNLIGGESSGQPNAIAFNGSNGVTVVSNAVNNAIFANAIFTNSALGIDLGGDGVTPNHPFGALPSGPNHFQNFPVLTTVLCSNNGILVQGFITNTTASTPLHIEFFANTVCDPSGFGQGSNFFGTADVTSDLSGGATFSVPFTNSNLVSQFITATASDSSSNTSEFSQCISAPEFTNALITINNCTNITVSVTTQLETVVTFPIPTATDICSVAATVTVDKVSGSPFPLGTSHVTATAVDIAGNTASCTFDVTVKAPVEVIVDFDPGVCPVILNTKEGGVFPVAIVGSESLNVANIITNSVTLNGVSPVSNSIETNGAAPFVYTHGCDKNTHNGQPDLVVDFDVNTLVASLGKVKNGQTRVLTVSGTMNLIGTIVTTNGTVYTTNNTAVVGTATFIGQDKLKISTKRSPLPKGLKNPF